MMFADGGKHDSVFLNGNSDLDRRGVVNHTASFGQQVALYVRVLIHLMRPLPKPA